MYCKINSREATEYKYYPTKYIEISDLNNLGNGTKNKPSTRLCKKGDILLSSLYLVI